MVRREKAGSLRRGLDCSTICKKGPAVPMASSEPKSFLEKSCLTGMGLRQSPQHAQSLAGRSPQEAGVQHEQGRLPRARSWGCQSNMPPVAGDLRGAFLWLLQNPAWPCSQGPQTSAQPVRRSSCSVLGPRRDELPGGGNYEEGPWPTSGGRHTSQANMTGTRTDQKHC